MTVPETRRDCTEEATAGAPAGRRGVGWSAGGHTTPLQPRPSLTSLPLTATPVRPANLGILPRLASKLLLAG